MNFWLHLSSPLLSSSVRPMPLQSMRFVPLLVFLFDDRSFGNFTVDDFVAFVPLALRKHALRRINIGRFTLLWIQFIIIVALLLLYSVLLEFYVFLFCFVFYFLFSPHFFAHSQIFISCFCSRTKQKKNISLAGYFLLLWSPSLSSSSVATWIYGVFICYYLLLCIRYSCLLPDESAIHSLRTHSHIHSHTVCSFLVAHWYTHD